MKDEKYVLARCKDAIGDVVIADCFVAIDDGAFYGCPGMTSVTIPGSVTRIGDGAFYGCTGLTSVTIPDSVTSIGDRAFIVCDSLTDVFYGGTEEQWRKLLADSFIDEDEPLAKAKIHFNS